MKRITDIVLSLFGLVLGSPIILLIAVLIKVESKGPVIYACNRVGRYGKRFGMLKFRTMVENADQIDCKLCPGGDVRVTDLGRFLRRTKLNELPQLFNVLMGEMSIVGPRPEDPKFLLHYKEKWDLVLSAKPGIFGPNQLLNRNEEDLFPVGVDPEAFYVESILPEKLERDIAYAKHHSLLGDIILVLKGVHATLFRGITLRNVVIDPITLRLFIWDLGLSGLAYVLAHFLKYEKLSFEDSMLINLAFLLLVNPILFFCMGLYKRSVRFFSHVDFIHLVKISLVSLGLLMAFDYFFMIRTGFSRLIYILYPIILTSLLGAKRMIGRLMMERSEILSKKKPNPSRTLIYGAGRRGTEILKRLKFEPDYEVLGFIDDDPRKKNRTIMGTKVLGTGLDIQFLKSLLAIQKVFVAFEPTESTEIDRVRAVSVDAGIEDTIIETSMFEVVGDTLLPKNYFRSLRFTDTIGIRSVSLKRHSLHADLEGSTVAIVGAGDPVGEELCSGLMALGVKSLVIIEDCEARMERINRFIRAKSKVNHQSYFAPLGTLIMERQLARHDVKWMIYNGLNRPMVEQTMTFSTQYMLRLKAAVQFIKLADRIGCDSFTFMSPLGKAGLSARERELAALLENFISYRASRGSNNTRSASVRPATVIEDQNGSFLKLCQILSQGEAIELPQKTIRLTSANNAARLVINSYPLHNKGAVFVDGSSAIYDLRTLLIQFFQFCGDGTGKTSLILPFSESETDLFSDGSEGFGNCEETEVPHLLRLNRLRDPHLGLMKDLDNLQNLYGPTSSDGDLEHVSALLDRLDSGRHTSPRLRAAR